MLWIENIQIALRNLRANKGRASLTILIIAVGVMALVAILTSLDILIFSLSDNFSRLGANSFSIEPSSQVIQTSDGGRMRKRGEPIKYDQAIDFKDRFEFAASVAISLQCTGNATVRFQDEKTTPTVQVMGIDENYLATVKYDFASGRNFSTQEVEYGNNRAIIGSDLVNKLYKGNANAALNTSISIGNVKYKVVGVLASKGSSMNQRSDRIILIPLMNAKSQYGTLESNYNVNVSVNNSTEIDEAVSMATGLMRNLRKLRATQENDFEITKSDGLIDIIKENTATIRWGVIFIAIITLLGAAIGLMNIMLERTKEIGIIKAVGATQRSILTQFLTEAVVICQIGGVLAAFLGILIGFAVSAIIKGPFIIPWNWIILAIFLCFLVGLLSGLYPALKASRLDPIESLRYE